MRSRRERARAAATPAAPPPTTTTSGETATSCGGEELVQPDAREPGRDEAAGVLGGGARLPADPLDLLAQVHELQVLGRAACRCEHAAERRLVLPR